MILASSSARALASNEKAKRLENKRDLQGDNFIGIIIRRGIAVFRGK
jgi:hypothetical protein